MKNKSFLKDVTFLVKTFERKGRFKKLIQSIEKIHPESRVIVLDDSKEPYSREILEPSCLDYAEVECQYDVGLGYGRNLLLNEVETKYFVLLDDDFEITEPVFNVLLSSLKRDGDDLVASTLWNTTKRKEDAINNRVFIQENKMIQQAIPFDEKGYGEMVNNCFIAKTDVIRPIGWDPVFKIAGEHTDFALRLSAHEVRTKIVRIPGILHHQGGSTRYMRKRRRSHASLLLSKYGCDELHQSNGKVLPIKKNVDYFTACGECGFLFGVPLNEKHNTEMDRD